VATKTQITIEERALVVLGATAVGALVAGVLGGMRAALMVLIAGFLAAFVTERYMADEAEERTGFLDDDESDDDIVDGDTSFESFEPSSLDSSLPSWDAAPLEDAPADDTGLPSWDAAPLEDAPVGDTGLPSWDAAPLEEAPVGDTGLPSWDAAPLDEPLADVTALRPTDDLAPVDEPVLTDIERERDNASAVLKGLPIQEENITSPDDIMAASEQTELEITADSDNSELARLLSRVHDRLAAYE